MELRLTSDQETRLAALADRDGRETSDLVREAVTRYLEEEARFADAVVLGIAAADQGDFISPDEVWGNVERALKP